MPLVVPSALRAFLSGIRGAPGPAAGLRVLAALALVALAALWPSAVLAQNVGLLFPGTSEATNLFFGFFIGVMLTASLYLFFIWIILHERGQVYLMLLLLCLGVNIASTNDGLMHMMGVHNPVLWRFLQNTSLILAYIFSLLFTDNFLEVSLHAPRLQPFLVLLVILLGALLVVATLDPRAAVFGFPLLGTLSMGVILGAGLAALRYGVGGSLGHIVAFSFFLLGGLAAPLQDLGYLPDPETTKNFAYAFFALAALVFATLVAGQFAERQEEKERALLLSNERFALAARGSNEGLFDWNLATGEVYFSAQFYRILGRSLETTPRGLRAWVKLMLPPDRFRVFRELRRFRDDSQAATIVFEYRIARAREGWRWIHTKMVATRDPPTGRVQRLVGSISDITATRRGEAALRASEARFRSITEAHPVPVLIARLPDTQVLYGSPGAEALLGLPQSTLSAHALDRFLANAEQRNDILDSMIAEQEVTLKEVELTRGDGHVFPAALSARRINYLNEPAMVVGLYDLTERKRAEAQIAHQQEALQQSEKMAALGGLLAGVAHELNNPLSVVVGQATLLIETSPEAKVTTRAEKIFKAADRCSRIVKSFLALARRKPPERKAVELNGVITASLDLLSYQFRNAQIEVALELAPGLPDVTGDGDQLTQVFTNLALNAAQAMQDWTGPRRLAIRTAREAAGGVLATVADTGPGIPAPLRSRVFEPFFTTKSGAGGTGVGLSLCLNIVASHGGEMTVEDTPGGGATFRIRLPAAAVSGAGDTAAPDGQIVGVGAQKILLVDDELELAQTLADLLEPRGYTTALAINGAVALEKLRKESFDLIISDLRMPVMDGPTLYAELAKDMPRYLDRIIYVTGDTLSPHVQAFLAKTPVPVIEKPYRLVDVQNAIARLLKKPGAGGMMDKADSAPPPSPPSAKPPPA